MSDFDPSAGQYLSNPVTGAEFAAWSNELAAFVLSGGYGAAAPTHADAGLIWSKNTGGVPDPYLFDGVDSHLIYSVANILGTVSGDGSGQNTGAVIEMGRVSGTTYAKFAGGLAICAARLTNHPLGTETWTLPINFTDTDKMYCAGSVRHQLEGRLISMQPATVNSIDIAVWRISGDPSTSTAHVICVGPWTEEFL